MLYPWSSASIRVQKMLPTRPRQASVQRLPVALALRKLDDIVAAPFVNARSAPEHRYVGGPRRLEFILGCRQLLLFVFPAVAFAHGLRIEAEQRQRAEDAGIRAGEV